MRSVSPWLILSAQGQLNNSCRADISHLVADHAITQSTTVPLLSEAEPTVKRRWASQQ